MKALIQPVEGACQPNILQVTSREVRGHSSLLRLSDGSEINARRFLPLGEGDEIRLDGDRMLAHVKRESSWITDMQPQVMAKAMTASAAGS